MDFSKDIGRILKQSKVVDISNNSKIVILSDIHRGDGSWSDDFARNQNLYFAALNYYYKEKYTYIENGDGDELWENKYMEDIKEIHSNVFWLLSKFYKEGRLYFIYGNHDMEKKEENFVKEHFTNYYEPSRQVLYDWFPYIKIHEGIVLRYNQDNNKIIFIVHGHQVDFLNNQLWKLARFLVRYLWRPLEIFGLNDPTRAAKNYKKKDKVDLRLTEAVIDNKCIIISGHTHRPMFPEIDEPPYFNDGSCVHPRCITGIEIVNGCIMLIKWCTKTRQDGALYVAREVLAGPRNLDDYFRNLLN